MINSKILYLHFIYIYIAIVRITIYNIRTDFGGAERIFQHFILPFNKICLHLYSIILTIINLLKTAYEQRRILVRHLQIRLP